MNNLENKRILTESLCKVHNNGMSQYEVLQTVSEYLNSLTGKAIVDEEMLTTMKKVIKNKK
ncbi:MAG: hypothetical protein ACRC3I_01925 [Cetobacterium sp.]